MIRTAAFVLVPSALSTLFALPSAVEGLRHQVTGTGPAVVLVHAFHMDLRQWDEQVPVLARDYQVVRYDVRGHGQSAPPPARDYAPYDDLRSLVAELGLERVTVVGHSMGGGIAIDFALAYPDLVERLVLVSPSLGGYQGGAPGAWFLPIIDAVRAGNATRAAELWWESPLMAGVKARGGAGQPYRRIVLDNARIWTLSRAGERPLTPPAVDRLAALAAPTLVVVGERDEAAVKAGAKLIIDRAPRARLVVMPRVGHMAPLEAPAGFNRLLSEFLRSR